MQDSVYIRNKGDTVFVDWWRYVYKDKLVTDTLLVNDTVRVPYQIEKQLTRWQQAKMDVGDWVPVMWLEGLYGKESNSFYIVLGRSVWEDGAILLIFLDKSFAVKQINIAVGVRSA